MSRLEAAVHEAASGHIEQEVVLPKGDDEIRTLGMAVNDMLANLRTMVQSIEGNFAVTDKSVEEIAAISSRAVEQATGMARIARHCW